MKNKCKGKIAVLVIAMMLFTSISQTGVIEAKPTTASKQQEVKKIEKQKQKQKQKQSTPMEVDNKTLEAAKKMMLALAGSDVAWGKEIDGGSEWIFSTEDERYDGKIRIDKKAKVVIAASISFSYDELDEDIRKNVLHALQKVDSERVISSGTVSRYYFNFSKRPVENIEISTRVQNSQMLIMLDNYHVERLLLVYTNSEVDEQLHETAQKAVEKITKRPISFTGAIRTVDDKADFWHFTTGREEKGWITVNIDTASREVTEIENLFEYYADKPQTPQTDKVFKKKVTEQDARRVASPITKDLFQIDLKTYKVKRSPNNARLFVFSKEQEATVSVQLNEKKQVVHISKDTSD
ncbi:hypothetical protein NQ117_00980 [Paenibacillus sp. SC116]|uniref:hypothetical protein n=1 Tax=Paenibacillus sp. SC116 TaxID=2968986 RepID=UPI00215AD8E8|nr:hypothetical protein [Paenibacillus sp. SC116]MCR8842247.1 hypothetical protein [Paenibacillus sp. SC116]